MNDGRNFNITINSSTVVKIALIILLIWGLFYIRDIVLVILAAVVIASSIEPLVLWAEKKRIKRLLAVIFIYLLITLILILFFVFFLPSLLEEAVVYLNNIPENISLSDIGFSSTNQLVETISDKSFSIKQFIESLKTFVPGTSESAFKTASIIFGGALSFVLMIVLSFYLAVQQDGVGNFLRIVSPPKHHDYIINLWKRSQRKIGYWMQGQLLLGFIIGILVYLGLMILGIKHALLLASIAAVFELIPIFGPILSAVPAVLIAVVNGAITSGLLVIGLYIIIHQFENHLLYPLVVRKIIGISPIIVIIALVIGAKLAGFIGVLLAVPIASALMEYVNDLEEDKRLYKNSLI